MTRKWVFIEPIGINATDQHKARNPCRIITSLEIALVGEKNEERLFAGGCFQDAGHLADVRSIAGCNGDGIWIDNVLGGAPSR